MIQSLQHAGRRLRRAPGFTAAAIITLALGIGGTTAIFSVVNAVLLRPLPYAAADRLVSLSHTLVVGGDLRVDQSDASILSYQRHHDVFTQVGGYQITAAAVGSLDGADAERLPASRATADLFPALQVTPLRGRLFAAADDRPGSAPVVLLGERLWRRKYGSDPAILGRAIEIDGVAHEVIGILPASVSFPASDTALWVPMRLNPAKTDSATFDYQAVARLRDGVSLERATEALQALLLRVPDDFPGRLTRASIDQTHMRVSVRPLAAVVVGDIGSVLWIALAAAGFVLAIACANVGNLFLVRAEGRQNALAVQRALGAASWTVFLEFLYEGVIVAVAGGLLGAGAAATGIRALQSLDRAIDIPRLAEVDIDGRVLAVVIVLTLGAALFVSLLPALRARSVSLTSVLSATSRSTTAGRQRQRARQLLVVSQVALALVLLVGSGLMARSVWRLRAVQPGFDPANAITFRLGLPSAAYPDADAAVRLFSRAVDELTAIPGVQAAGAVSKLPLEDQGRTDTGVFVEDRPMAPGSLPGIHPVVYATPGYFGAAGIPFVAGRAFAKADPPRVVLEAIVSRAFAERYWPNQSPLGRRVRILFRGGPWYTVVGVVGDVREAALDRPADQTIYCPLLPAREDQRWAPRDLAFVVRTAGDPTAFVGPIRNRIRSLDRSLPVYRVRALADLVAHASARRSLTLILIACASGVAILLGAIGLYGVMSYVVTLRAREMGIRLALGAQPGQLRRMVSRQALTVAALGIAIGLAGALALTRYLSALLFEVSATDPLVLVLSAALLLAVAGAASWLPARRAATVDPALALRAD